MAREQERVDNARFLEKRMFEFSKRRLAEIEVAVEKTFNEQKKIENSRVTRLRNAAITSDIR